MANTIEIVIRADNKASGQIKALVGDIGKQFESLGKKMAVGGLALGAAIAPAALGFKSAINSARQFDETMTDAQAILGVAALDGALKRSARPGRQSVAGPQAAAAAFVGLPAACRTPAAHVHPEAAMKTAGPARRIWAPRHGPGRDQNLRLLGRPDVARERIMTRTVGMGVLTWMMAVHATDQHRQARACPSELGQQVSPRPRA